MSSTPPGYDDLVWWPNINERPTVLPRIVANAASKLQALSACALIPATSTGPPKCTSAVSNSKFTRHPNSAAPAHAKLTMAAINDLEKHYNEGAASFDEDVRSRTLQHAGKKLDFDFRLECFESAMKNIEEWCESQKVLFKEPSIFKDPQDIRRVCEVAELFDVAFNTAMADHQA